MFLVYGGLMGKAFVFISIPVGALLIFNRRALSDRVYAALTRRDPLSGISWALLISVMYGICEVVYGILSGNNSAAALKILLFNLFPFHVFLGIWAGTRRPDLMRGFIRFFAWFNAIYAPIYLLFLRRVNIVVPGTDYDVLGQPGSGSGVLLGLLCFESNLASFWFPIAVCAFLTIAAQVRADWLGFGIALAIWGMLTRKLGRVFLIAGVLFALLLIGFIADIRLPALPGRGGEISTRETLGRALSGVDAELAEEYTSNFKSYAGTVYWRQTWWNGIREAVFEHYHTLIFGLGYGYPLKNLGTPELRRANSSITSPHNIFYFALGYSGCIGALLFYSLQASILSLLWRTYKETSQPFGLVFYVAILVGAHFGNFLEAPQTAIPTYIMTGWCIGPLFHKLQLLGTSHDYQSTSERSNIHPAVHRLTPHRVAPLGSADF
jgi:hypothetical protein